MVLKISQWHECKTQIGMKKYWTMVFNQIAVHMQKFGQIQATSKNRLKFDIRQLCSQPFNLQWNLSLQTPLYNIYGKFTQGPRGTEQKHCAMS